jgi:hypothetical protein
MKEPGGASLLDYDFPARNGTSDLCTHLLTPPSQLILGEMQLAQERLKAGMCSKGIKEEKDLCGHQ